MENANKFKDKIRSGTDVFASVAVGGGPEEFAAWVRRGVQWIPIGGDISFMLSAANQAASQVREHWRRTAAWGEP